MKITPESMKKQYEDLWNIFCKKNHDYGSSFERSLDKHGLVAGVVRMEDKMNRLSTLTQGDKDAQIASESLVDTLMDLSNYAAMSACWLMHKDDEFDDHISKGFSGHVVVTDEENLEKMKSLLHLSSFEGHQEKVNERAYYNRDDDFLIGNIIKNWGIVGDTIDNIQTIRSRVTGQYFTEDDNPELFRKICGVLRGHYGHKGFKKIKDQLTGTDEEFEGRFNDIKELVVDQINRSRDIDRTEENVYRKYVKDYIEGLENHSNKQKKPLLTDTKGLENEYFIRQHTNPEDSSMHNIHYGVTHHSDGGLTVFYKNGEDDSDDEYKLSNFEGHQEKVNEREYFNGVLSDHTIIKNWALVGDSKTVRSRTTGQYLTEDDNPELFRKIYGVLKAQDFTAAWKPAPEDITKASIDNIKADMESDTEVICRTVRDSKNKSLLTDPKGLENGYFIRQHTNPEDSSRYTLAFNPEGTVKTQLGEELPYVIECYGNNHYGMTRWAIHVFNTREDMVAALNYDLKKHLTGVECKNFGDAIGELNITKYMFSPENTTTVFTAWMDTFGESFIKNMTSRDIFSDGYFGVKQGIRTFSMVFISEKTGALVVKGILYTRTTGLHNIIWFSDTKEVLLEVNNVIPKFNDHGIIYGVDSELFKNVDNLVFNPLYNNMEDKILSKFHTWDGSELKNLVFFNEDE